MRITYVKRLPNRLGQTVHLRVARPIKIGQRPRRPQSIARRIIRPSPNINTAYIFPPADGLTDKSFGGIDRHPPRFPFGLNGPAQIKRIEQPDIEIGRQQRMPKQWLPCQHRILIIAEIGEGLLQESRLLGQRAFVRHGQIKPLQPTRMIGKARRDQRQNVRRDGIWLCPLSARNEEARFRRLAILRIIIPHPACGLISLHQQTRHAPHLTIEIFHAELAAAFGPAVEETGRRHKARVGQNLDRYAQRLRPALHSGLHAPFAGLRHANF